MYEDYLKEYRELTDRLSDPVFLANVGRAVDVIHEALGSGKKILIAGNGGSAADAQHFAAEFVGRFKKEERRAYPAIALTTDTSFLTAWSNDYAFNTVFTRQIEALGNDGDVFVGISTSGNSPNILAAFEAAKTKGMATVALLGESGGKVRGVADIEFLVPSSNTPRIQEAHTFLLHMICEEVIKQLTA